MRCLLQLLVVSLLLGSVRGESAVETPSDATTEWNASDGLGRVLLSATYLSSPSSASTSLAPTIASAPPVPYLLPLLAVGDVVGAVPTAATQRGSRFQLVEYVQSIPAPRSSSASDAATGLLPSSVTTSPSDGKTLSFAPTLLSQSLTQQPSTSASHALVSTRDELSLRQFERLVSLPYLSLAPSYLDADDTLLQSALSSTVAASVPSVTATSTASSSSSSASFDYTLHSRIGRGGYGELWKARKLPANSATAAGEQSDDTDTDSDSDSESESEEYYILKRLLIEKGEHVRVSGLREIHFGQLLSDQPHIARFLEWFELKGELWLVFKHEGMSLAAYMRRVEAAAHEEATEEAGREVLTPEWQMLREDMMSEDERWVWDERRRRDGRYADDEASDDEVEHDTVDLDVLEHPIPSILPPSSAHASALSALPAPSSPRFTPARRDLPASDTSSSPSCTGPAAGSLLRDLLHQVLTGVAEGHRLGVTHRDIKPQNILLKLHRHHPHHRFLQHRHGHDFLTVDEETSEQQYEHHHHNDTDETRGHSHDLPSPDTVSSSASTSSSSSLSSPPSSASFSFPAALSSLGHVRLCDYGSATDASEEVNQRLYDNIGPSPLESTIDYAPPELLFSSSTSPSSSSSFFGPSYDSWSLGVLILELLLGGRERVFALDNRVKALIQARLGHRVREDVVEKAILFRAFIEYCVYPAGGLDQRTDRTDELPYTSACNHTHVGEMLRRYDPLGVGLGELGQAGELGAEERGQRGVVRSSVLLYAMVRGLLQWHPHLRLSVEDALQHAYFHGDWYRCGLCGQEHELPQLLKAHTHTHTHTHAHFERQSMNST